ncbi:hypothetical protein ABK040_007403 [Willaertia magna]
MSNNLTSNYFNSDILFEICKYFNNFKDVISFAQINKYYYDNLLLNNNFLNKIFINIKLKLCNELILPNYLFERLEKLILKSDSDLTILFKFKNLKSLTVKNLQNTQLSLLPNTLQKLKLKQTNLNTNNLSHLSQQLKSLQFFDYCDVKDEYLKDFINLQKLTISYIFSVTCDCLIYLNNLQELNAESILIKDEHLQNLMNLKKLNIELHVYNNVNLKDEYLINCKMLQVLNVNGCDNLFGSFLQNLQNLNSLYMSNTNIEERYLNNLNNLTKLNIFNCKQISGKCLLKLINLKILSCNNIKDEYLVNLINLQHLFIVGCQVITGKCLLTLQNLVKLDADHTNIKDDYFVNLKKLKTLNISHCKLFEGYGLKNLTNLEELIADHTNVKDEHLMNLKNLRELRIINCKNIIGECFMNMLKLKRLFYFNTNIKHEFILKLNTDVQLYGNKKYK